MSNKKNLKGMSLIEILTATAIAAIFFSAIYELLIFSVGTVENRTRKVEAVYLAQEGIEAVRLMRNESWSSNIAPLVAGTVYYPVISGTEWTLTTTNPGLIDNAYTRTVVLADVYRDVNDDISAVGALDPDTQKLTVEVIWNDIGAGTNSIVLNTYITNFLVN